MSLIQEKHLDKNVYIYESVVVPIKDNAYLWNFSLLLARSARANNICIYLYSGDPHKVGYSLNNCGHNISFGKCTRALTILDPPGPIELSNQSTAGMRFCCAFHQPQQNVQKCWTKTILMHQTGMVWLFSSILICRPSY